MTPRRDIRKRVDLDAALRSAVRAARAAGGHALANMHRRSVAIARTRHDVKLALDVECQQRAFAALARAVPGARVLGEESAPGTENARDVSGWVWVVDPIDGTVNFSHGLPLWCASVALLLDGKTRAAAVFAPVLGELYTATGDGKARLNGRPIRVSSTSSLAASIVMTSLDRHRSRPNILSRAFHRIAAAVQRPRILGSAALDVCSVAAGFADGYYEGSVFLWDIAAASLIVERAGGRAEVIRRYDGNRMAFMASNGRIHAALKTVVTGTPAGRATR